MLKKINKYLPRWGWHVFIFFLIGKLFAQFDSPYFDLISVNQGLSCSSVFSIVQDSTGFMWFATEDGLNRFDGYECKVFRHDPTDTTTISENSVKKLFVDDKGRLWVISRSGRLDCFLPGSESFHHMRLSGTDSGGQLAVAALALDSGGRLFAANNRGCLYRFDPETQRFVLFTDTLRTYFENQEILLFSLHVDRSDRFWLGTWQGLIRFTPQKGSFTHFHSLIPTPRAPAGNMIMDMVEDRTGDLWFATNNGLSRWIAKEHRFVHFRHKENDARSLSSNRTISLLIDSRSRLWVGTLDKGICLFHPKEETFSAYEHNPAQSHSVTNGAVFDLFEDRNGGIWIATYGGGVSYYQSQRPRFRHFVYEPGNSYALSHNIVLSLLEDHTGALWVGTDGGGVNVLLRGATRFRHYLQQSGPFATNSITAIYESKDGTLWLGTDVGHQSPGGRILRFNRRKNRFEPFEAVKPKFGGVAVFLEDRSSALWIGTFAEGLYRFDRATGAVNHFKYDKQSKNSLCGNSVISLMEDKDGYLWIGMLNRGLNRYDPRTKTFTHYTYNPRQERTLGGNTVWCAEKDQHGNVWFGTNGGLSWYEPQSNAFRTFTSRDGLPSNMIYGIVPDAQGRLWLSTGRGLACFNPNDFSVKKYDAADGLLNIEFTQGAYCQSKNGLLYFGGNHGVTYFNPKTIKESAIEPPIVLTDFSVKGKPFPLPQSITHIRKIELKHRQNFFSFAFAALDYSAPNKIQYAYQLQGVDSGWVYCGNRRLAYYTDIAPGEYVFRVKGTNSDGVWSKHQAAVVLVIRPPFWQTWWFRLLLVLLFVVLLYALHNYRVNKLLEVERTRLRIARDLHDDVSATITGIAYFSEALEQQVEDQKTPAVEKLFGLIRESIQNVQESMSDIIWSIKPENDRWEIFFPKLRRFASELCESKRIRYHIEMPEQLPPKNLEMEKRRNLWLVFKELVTNGVKHSSCQQLHITLKMDKSDLVIRIADDGIGFDPSQHKEGNGIKNIYRRCEQLQAQVHLDTAPGQGTRWEIRIPL